MHFLDGLVGEESTHQCRRQRRHGFNPWVGISHGVGNGNPLQYSCLENSMDRGMWRATVHEVAKSRTRLKRLSSSSSSLLGFPGDSVVKNLLANAGDMGLIPGSGRSPGVGNGNSLQYSCLENFRDRGTRQATVHRIIKNQIRLRE